MAEKQHEKRYRDLLSNLESGRVFKRDEEVMWRCRNCGYLHSGKEAPGVCPAWPIRRRISNCWWRTGRAVCTQWRFPTTVI
ncbi:MAG: hypothetical protein WAN11_01075 [Syntrophobacteraceae bacterium]